MLILPLLGAPTIPTINEMPNVKPLPRTSLIGLFHCIAYPWFLTDAQPHLVLGRGAGGPHSRTANESSLGNASHEATLYSLNAGSCDRRLNGSIER